MRVMIRKFFTGFIPLLFIAVPLTVAQTTLEYKTTVPSAINKNNYVQKVPRLSEPVVCNPDNAGSSYVEEEVIGPETFYREKFCDGTAWKYTDPLLQNGDDIVPSDSGNRNLKFGIRVGNTSPPFALSIDTDSSNPNPDGGILAIGKMGDPASTVLPVSGTGTRLIWYPKKAALRAGVISGGGYLNSLVPGSYEWDEAYIGQYSVAFGDNPFAWHTGTSISGGKNNTASCWYSSVAGGYNNVSGNAGECLTDDQFSKAAAIGGGQNNRAWGAFSVISGGDSNTVWSGNSSVLGGRNNTAGTGPWNAALGQYITVGGGENNTALLDHSTIGGGSYNYITYEHNFIGGGSSNFFNGFSAYGVIGGGLANIIDNDAVQAVIGGGDSNKVSNSYSSVLGGQSNEALETHAFVGGGQSNKANGKWSVSAGGNNNQATADYSAILGGSGNSATSTYSLVTGGLSNIASGMNATVSGGQSNIAGGDYSWAGGRNVQLSDTADRTFAWGYDGTNPLTVTQSDSFIIGPGTTVGIGTTSPTTTLHVRNMLRLEPLPDPPACANIGEIYVSSHAPLSPTICICNGSSAWIDMNGYANPGNCI